VNDELYHSKASEEIKIYLQDSKNKKAILALRKSKVKVAQKLNHSKSILLQNNKNSRPSNLRKKD
jgi:hypothetical protein